MTKLDRQGVLIGNFIICIAVEAVGLLARQLESLLYKMTYHHLNKVISAIKSLVKEGHLSKPTNLIISKCVHSEQFNGSYKGIGDP